jgi:DNA mismatch repair protein MutS2
LNAQIEKLREREASLARVEDEAIADAEKTRERAELERKRLRAEVAELIEELRRDGATLMDDLKTRAKSRTDLKGFITKAAAKLESLAPAPESAPESDAPLKVGDSVEVGDIRGELIVLDASRAVISRGGLRIEVAPDRLRRSAASATENRPAQAKATTVTYIVEGSEGTELNLIGMRTTDALRKLEEFLDTAFLTNRSEVRIVHGIGSGALRKAVAEYLGTSPYCASFRGAEPHHGGAGATIVQMNL